MNLTPKQAEAFAETARRLRGKRGAPSVAKAVSDLVGFVVSHQSIYQWEDPTGPKPETMAKVWALDEVLGGKGELVRLVLAGGDTDARLSRLENMVSEQQKALRKVLRRLDQVDRG